MHAYGSPVREIIFFPARCRGKARFWTPLRKKRNRSAAKIIHAHFSFPCMTLEASSERSVLYEIQFRSFPSRIVSMIRLPTL